MSQPEPGWIGRVRERLTARLETNVEPPIALALSGGGDSVALLHVAANWVRGNGRRLLALTVDHGLNPDSPAWSRSTERMARSVGADWRELRWVADKPATGLAAAARLARHRLIADAARQAGARVVLFAHTADDIAESELMRAQGSTLGRLRDWAPSPVWPEGRGLMLLRPLLDVRRPDLRAWLGTQGADWIEDPANDDLRSARSRARRALGGRVEDRPPADPTAPPRGLQAVRDDVVYLARDADARTLSAAMVCAGGGDRPPRGDRLDSLRARLRAGEIFAATLCGARLQAHEDRVIISREAGEFRRHAGAVSALPAGAATIWDGRWWIAPTAAAGSVGPAAGRLGILSDADKGRLRAIPAAARGARPVLIRYGSAAPILAEGEAGARALVAERLALTLDRMTHERDLGAAMHGATPRNHLFSGADITE